MEYVILMVSLVGIVLGADWLVAGAVSIAKKYKVSDFVIGAAIVGVGTSMPELVVSFIGAVHGNADVAIGNAKDPQFQKLLKIISQFTHQEEISVLDFGAGSGRIAKCFELLEKEQPNLNIWKKLKYSLYDKYKIDDSLPEKEWINEKIKSENELIKNNKKYDIIIVYNVLHEVSIEKWVQTLKLIINSLNYGGYLLFGERKVLSKGEKPYGKSGYLVLEKNELKLLFSTKSIEEIVLKEKKQDATICYAMKRSSIQIPTTEEVKKALIELKSRLNKEIYRILLSENKIKKYMKEYPRNKVFKKWIENMHFIVKNISIVHVH